MNCFDFRVMGGRLSDFYLFKFRQKVDLCRIKTVNNKSLKLSS